MRGLLEQYPGNRSVPVIIGVTGSRNWTSREIIAGALTDATRIITPGPIVVIEGGAKGADAIARIEANSRGWHVATVRAIWGFYGNAAGHIRDAAMLHLGAEANYWLAFINPCIKKDCPVQEPHDSHGAAGCVKHAKASGIEVREYRNG
jgi:hypothetical protein